MWQVTPEVWSSSGTVGASAVAVLPDGSSTTLRVADGEVTMDATRDVRWSASLTVSRHTDDGDLLPLTPSSPLHPAAGALIHLTVSRGPDEVPAGVYVVDEITPSAGRLDVQLVDVSRALSPQDAYQATAGATASVAIGFLLATSAGAVPYRVPSGGVPVPDETVISAPGEDPWTKVRGIALASCWDAYADRAGTIVVAPLRDPGPSVWRLVEGEDCTVSDLSVTVRRGEYRNAVKVTSEQPWAGFADTVYQSHPDDPYSTAPRAVYIPDLPFGAAGPTVAGDLQRALLARVVAANDPVQATGLPLPFLDADDVVTLDARGYTGPHWVRAWTCPLAPGKGTVRLHRIREVVASHA